MKILKPGKLGMKKFTCARCGCVFAAQLCDIHTVACYGHVYCPTCGIASVWDSGEPYEEPKQSHMGRTKEELVSYIRLIEHARDAAEEALARQVENLKDWAPVQHGEWTKSEDNWNSLTTITCSRCHEEWCFETEEDVSLLNYRYCPNCGAKMNRGADSGE